MKKRILVFTALALVLAFLAGCGGNATAEESSAAMETVANLFTSPTEQTADGDETTETSHFSDGTEFFGSVGAGFEYDETSISEQEQTIAYDGGEVPLHKGLYFVYSGGEMHLDFKITYSGTMAADGVGLMFILDGIPQPYRTADQEEYTYLHTFYPPSKREGTISIELIFTPVTGKAGDNLVLQTIRMFDPDFDPTTGTRAFMGGQIAHQCQFLMTADPPETEMPAVTERVTDLSLEMEDLTSTDIAGWSAERLQKNFSFKYYADAAGGGNFYFGLTDDSTLNFHVEVFSPSAVQWGLLLYIDNEPVSIQPENIIQFSTPSGQKAVIDIALDLTGFREYAPFYAVLVIRNYYDPVFATLECYAQTTTVSYLSTEENLDAWLAKYCPD